MPKTRLFRIEVTDPETGGRVTITFEGGLPPLVSREIGAYLSELLSCVPVQAADNGKEEQNAPMDSFQGSVSLSTFGKIKSFVLKHFRYGTFTSRDVQDEFERAFGEKLKGSTVSTYLTRLSDPASGILERNQGSGGYDYRLRGEKFKDQIAETERLDSVDGSSR